LVEEFCCEEMSERVEVDLFESGVLKLFSQPCFLLIISLAAQAEVGTQHAMRSGEHINILSSTWCGSGEPAISRRQMEFREFVEQLKRQGIQGEQYRDKVAQWNREHPADDEVRK
jgi:hypothetical protein